MLAVKRGNMELLQLLFNHPSLHYNDRVLVDMPKLSLKAGDTALHLAVRMGNEKVIKLLLKNDPTIIFLKNDNGEKAIDIADGDLKQQLSAFKRQQKRVRAAACLQFIKNEKSIKGVNEDFIQSTSRQKKKA